MLAKVLYNRGGKRIMDGVREILLGCPQFTYESQWMFTWLSYLAFLIIPPYGNKQVFSSDQLTLKDMSDADWHNNSYVK